MNKNIQGDFQICISVPLNASSNKRGLIILPKMKDFIFSNYLRGFGFTYYEFSFNLARLRLNFPLIIARIENNTTVKILIFLQITVENKEKIGEKKDRERVFFPFTFQLIFILIDNI